jgi:proteasome lid subunit RPN8/RPN11
MVSIQYRIIRALYQSATRTALSKVVIKRELLEMILEGARRLHPRESIVLLRGKVQKENVRVSDVLIPPFATYGRGFSGFPTHMLPMDFSIIGVAHSHPSGSLKPSIEDQNLSMGRIMLIVGFPYAGKENAKVYNKQGEILVLEVI